MGMTLREMAKALNRRAKARGPRRKVGVSRVRAAAIARAKRARELICCEVYDELPAGYSVYWRRPRPKNCWYVVCGPRHTNTTGGSRTLLCIAKRSGRVLLATEVRGE